MTSLGVFILLSSVLNKTKTEKGSSFQVKSSVAYCHTLLTQVYGGMKWHSPTIMPDLQQQ